MQAQFINDGDGFALHACLVYRFAGVCFACKIYLEVPVPDQDIIVGVAELLARHSRSLRRLPLVWVSDRLSGS